MKIGHSIDSNGYLTGDILGGTGITPTVTVICQDGFYKPKWNNTAWVEGLTQAEIDAIKNAPKPPDPDVELANAINAATDIPTLKAALLGINGGRLAKVSGKLK